ncbi:MAG: class I SAM-dependent methyltransferase [Gammaproteobacteria bacterium]|nr:class I SAM-dependent methyltransferase [Gammaproteobacteria bacterium]
MHEAINQINSCEVCGNTELKTVLNLGVHPMCDDLVPVGEIRTCSEYPIEILFCKQCVTAHQKYQVPKLELFPESYHYRSRFTADVLKGMQNLVASCEEKYGDLSGKAVLDIGCNDGSLLDFFKKQGATTIGIEPTGAWVEAEKKGHVTYGNYLSKEVAQAIVLEHGKPDFITFTNVFAHIEDLNGVLEALKVLMKKTTKIIIENHYLGSVLDGNQFDTFYHEHPRTYSYTSFVRIAQSLGAHLEGVEFPSRYGGNIRVFIGNSSETLSKVDMEALARREGQFYDDFKVLRKNIEQWMDVKKTSITEQLDKYGRLSAKAFPGRAAILIKMLDLNENHIAKVYEKPGSLKIGHYLPGTRIPIHSDDELLAQKDKTQPLLNLAWHIPNEIKAYLKNNGYEGEVFDILSEKDFAFE